MPRPTVRVTEIGEYIRYRSCERRFKLGFNNRQLAKQLPFAERLFNNLDPVLIEHGRQRENEWESTLRGAGLESLTQQAQSSERQAEHHEEVEPDDWDALAGRLQALSPGQPAYGREVRVAADMGAFHVEGRVDFVLLLWNGSSPSLRLVECKASRRDRTHQRVQVALYQMMVREMLRQRPLRVGGTEVRPDDVECVVARIDETTSESHEILALEPLDIEREEADIERLLAPDGALLRMVQSDLADLDYQLDPKCDNCIFNVHCFPESARLRRLELLNIEPSAARTMRAAEISTIDDLAELDLTGPQATLVRGEPSFTDNLGLLQQKARARRRTLPGGDADPDSYEVEALRNTGQGQLPPYERDGQRLIRVYLSVSYDYVENRIGAVAAHVTRSEGQINTGFVEADGRWRPDPVVRERLREEGEDEDGRPLYSYRPLRGEETIEFKRSEWSGNYAEDNGSEKELIQGFLQSLVDAIDRVAEVDEAPIHFYVWSRSEMTQLVEACSRVSSRLLGHLRELLGCRETLEQLIFSCLQEEVDQRYALGWTGRGLSVVSSLRWFGRRYHWVRSISGREVRLDDAFTQDIFDFKTTLAVNPDDTWATAENGDSYQHRFEIRSRFHDSLSAPYWRAYWRDLPAAADIRSQGDPRTANAIDRYNWAQRPNYLQEYLRARTHALRWVEEGVRFKNGDIRKPLLNIAQLPSFQLEVDTTAQAAIDFLRLDHYVKLTEWIAQHLVPPASRVPLGRTIPVANLESLGGGRLRASIDLDGHAVDRELLMSRSTIDTGSMVRVSPCAADPERGQTLRQLVRGGITCKVGSIDWQDGQIDLDVIWQRDESHYVLKSTCRGDEGLVFEHATLDESVSDFVAGRVESRLQDPSGGYVNQWFDPEDPRLPELESLPADRKGRYRELLDSLRLPDGRGLSPDQVAAVADGLDAKVQLLQGPPGTGKTMTTATAVLTRVLARRGVGDIVLVAAHTHTAVDGLLQRIDGWLDAFTEQAGDRGLSVPRVRLAKVHSSDDYDPSTGRIEDVKFAPSVRAVNRLRDDAVLVIGGTTSALLKLTRELSGRLPFRNYPNGFQVPALIVDEASMMVFPHFLALATVVTPEGEIMLTGDHRQLAPIVAHDWEREDRPPAVLYQPFASAYQAILNMQQSLEERGLAVPDTVLRRSALHFTFRLPPLIRDLIARLYRLDDIELEGLTREGPERDGVAPGGDWEAVWRGSTGLYLVLHDEHQSRRSNEVEAHIIDRILDASGELPDGSAAIITPHRAQRALLKRALDRHIGPVDVIDTVDRLQGGERSTVIVSGTASDPSSISTSVEFILDLNRSNVAFSRAKDRLIVVCSTSLLDHIPAEMEHYDATLLWKSLRRLCSELITTQTIDGHAVRVYTPPIDVIESVADEES